MARTPLKLIYIASEGDFESGMNKFYEPISKAATAAITEAGRMALEGGRASILAGGMGYKWANTWKLKVFPGRGRVSVNAAALLYHKIGYANVFQEGLTVHGKPRLFVPVSSAPKKLGRLKMTPKNYERAIGKLYPVKRPGHPLLLVAKVYGTAAIGRGKFTRATLRSATSKKVARNTVSVPIFFAVDQVKEPKRFDVIAPVKRASERLGSLYYSHVRPG